MKWTIRARAVATCALLIMLAACHRDTHRHPSGGTPPPAQTYTVGGSVSGLSGTGLVLRINDTETIAIAGNGAFTFPASIAAGASFNVVIATQPVNPVQVCSISGGAGTISGNVTNIAVVCATNSHTLGGTVSGLVGSGLSLTSGTGESLAISANGAFEFPTAIADGAAYSVTITSQPAAPAQLCTLMNGSGTIASDVTNVAIVCTTNAYSVGGTVSGLSGTGLVLQLNGGNDLPVNGNGVFTFAPSLVDGDPYSITVLTQPSGPLQTCVVTPAAGSIAADNVNVSVACTVNRYTVGGTVSGLVGTDMVLNNGVEQLAVSANGSFTFATPLDPGSNYDITIDHNPGAPAQQCAVANGSGTLGAANVTTVSVTCAAPMYPTFMLATNAGDSTLSVLAMDEGRLRMREPVPTGSAPADVAVYTAGGSKRFAYVANRNSDNVSAFEFDARQGKLAEIPGSPFASDDDPVEVTLHPTKPFLYAFNRASRTLRAFTIDETTGALTDRNAVNVYVPDIQLLIEPSGRFAYVLASFATQTLQTYAIDQVTGALSLATPSINIPNNSSGMTLDGKGRHLYVFNPGSDLIHSYTLDAVTGEPVAMAGSPLATGGGGLVLLATHPNGRFIYATSGLNLHAGVTVFAISPTGTLSVVAGGPFGSGIDPSGARLDPTGRYLYVTDFQGGWRMHKFAVDTVTGTLSAPVTTTIPSGSLLQAPLIDSRGEYLYQPGDGSMLAYGIDADTGALVPSNWSVAHIGAYSAVSAIAEDSAPLEFVSDTVVSTSRADSRIYSFRLSAAGMLAGRSTMNVLLPAPVTIGPSGLFAYVPRSGNTVATFAINPANSTLSLFDEYMLSGQPAPIAISPTGRYSYAANWDALRTFVTNPDTGYWDSSLATVTLSTSVAEALVHPGSSFLLTRAVADGTPNESRVYRYKINPVTGVVDPVAGIYVDINGPTGGMVMHPSGNFLYVVNTQDDLIQAYSIQPGSGMFTPLGTDTPFVANGETGLAIDARGRFLFAVTATGGIQTFAIGTDGQLTELGDAVPNLTTATAIAADFSGNYLLVTDAGANLIKTYGIADDGSLVFLSSASRMLSPGVHAVKASERLQ